MLARCPGAWGPAQQLKCWSEDGNPASHGTVQLRLRKPTSCRKSTGESGLQGAWGRGPRAWGPAHQGPGAFSPQKPPKPLKLRFFRKPPVGSLAKAWVSAETAASEVGTWRETKPGYPPYPPPPHRFGAERKRKTLFAFGNHPTRPPRSADPNPEAQSSRRLKQKKKHPKAQTPTEKLSSKQPSERGGPFRDALCQVSWDTCATLHLDYVMEKQNGNYYNGESNGEEIQIAIETGLLGMSGSLGLYELPEARKKSVNILRIFVRLLHCR